MMRLRVLAFSVVTVACSSAPWDRAGHDAGPRQDIKEASGDAGIAAVLDGGDAVDASEACMTGPHKFRAPRTFSVVNGTRDPAYVALSDAQKRAIVGIAFDGPGSSECTGTLIAERTILTAKHCTEGENPSTAYALFGPDDVHPELAVRVVQKHEHATHDVALLQLERSPAELLDVTPISIALAELTTHDVGIQVENAGYGLTRADGDSNGRFFVVEQLVGFEAEGNVLVVYGGGDRGVCFGDSGGPSLRIDTGSEPRIIGVLSWGDESCVGRDRYARTDVVRGWIEEWSGPTPGSTTTGCGSLTREGQCSPSGSHAMFCDDGNQRIEEACGDGRSCQWDTVATGWRCADNGTDACAGLTAYGRCEGQDLRWCDRGVARSRTCTQCAEQCVLVDALSGFNCVQSACGDVTYTGRCDGSVAVWCDHEGQRRSVNCADDQQVCGFIDRSTGYYCLDHNDCGDLDYRGRCDGDVAKWCQGGDVHQNNCAADGKVCRYVNDDVGFFCTAP